jgi:hypothetical protein
MNNRLILIFLGLLTLSNTLKAQEIVWTGNNDADFFNELNWKISGSSTTPEPGTIDPGKTINNSLLIENSSGSIIANGTISLGAESFIVRNATLLGQAIENGTLTVDADAYVTFDSNSPLNGSANVNFNVNAGWLKLPQVKPEAVLSNFLSKIKINNQSASYKTNLRIDNYYANGALLRPENPEATPLTVYEFINQSGTSANLKINVVHSGSSIPNQLNDAISSFVLKRGFMAVMADNSNGTGISKVFIASEKDLVLNELPQNLKGNISFIRVIPWNWVSKRGLGGNKNGMNETWFYQWGNSGISPINKEYAPMAWGKGGADDDNDIALYKSKYKATHVMAFNESDNCNDQSGKYFNMCQPAVAVSYYENLMKSGMRLVSPSCRENAPFGYLKEFYDLATTQNIRIDVIGVHWYDWGSDPKNSPNATPQQVFNRFKNYLQRVYDLYKLPIWITEFNANPNRTTATNKGFMELALPYLDQLDYVERYAWFEPNSDVADYYESDGKTYTDVGIFYRDHQSTPSVPQDFLLSPSNLDNNISSGTSSNEIESNSNLLYKVIPNPSTNTVSITNLDIGTSLDFITLQGVSVYQTAYSNNLDVSALTGGIYFIRADDKIIKFIKK